MWETWVQSLHQEDSLEKEMATHSSIHARKIPWAEEPGGLQSMGSQKSQIRLSNYLSDVLGTKLETSSDAKVSGPHLVLEGLLTV